MQLTTGSRDEILFIDAPNLGQMITRRNRDFADQDVARIADSYHAWRWAKKR